MTEQSQTLEDKTNTTLDYPDPKTLKEKTKLGFWEKTWRKRKLKINNIVAVLYLNENGTAETMEVKSEKGFFNIKGKTYHERNDCTFTMSKDRYPLAIIHEWSITPEGTKTWDEKEIQEKFSLFQDHAIKGIRHAERVRLGERGEGIKLNGKAVVGLIIAAIVAIAFMMNFS